MSSSVPYEGDASRAGNYAWDSLDLEKATCNCEQLGLEGCVVIEMEMWLQRRTRKSKMLVFPMRRKKATLHAHVRAIYNYLWINI